MASFYYACTLSVHIYCESSYSVGYSLKGCLIASPSNRTISKIIEKMFFGTVREAPNWDNKMAISFNVMVVVVCCGD